MIFFQLAGNEEEVQKVEVQKAESSTKSREEQASPGSSPRGLQYDQFGDELDLPQFSSGVLQALQEDRSSEVWSELIDELLLYFARKFPTRMNNPRDYQQVGRKMFKSYPCIKRFGSHPWSALMTSLSNRMRTHRHKMKRRSDEEITSDTEPRFEMRVETELKPQVRYERGIDFSINK